MTRPTPLPLRADRDLVELVCVLFVVAGVVGLLLGGGRDDSRPAMRPLACTAKEGL